MSIKLISLSLSVVIMLGAVAFAQKPPSTAESTRGVSSTRKAADQHDKLNLNTATAGEMRKLPRITPGSVSAIIEARAKSKFKDWNDFVARRVVPAFAQDEIRDLVVF